jgi:hypothetical protein
MILSSLSGTFKTSWIGLQWLRGSDAKASDDKKVPISASYGCTDGLIDLRVTNAPSEMRVASPIVFPN